jgi:hypothetical protein
MSDPSLQQLERDVEAARAKLAGDLATLRSPATYSDFTSDLKEEAFDVKDALVDKAKSSVQATIESVVDDLKARAAANPTAALAIGAGIAWRLIQRPPIATALVGAGLYSLFRTTPTQTTLRTNEEGYLSQAKDRLAEQATEFAESVKDRAVAVGETAAEKTSELAGSVKDRVLAMGEAATEKATELAGAATEQAQQWSAHARSSTQQIAGDAAAKIGKASNNLEEMRRSAADNIDEWSRPVQETLRSQESRDNLLLGTAGVAVVAALGIACKRRLSEPAEVE